MVEVVYSFLQMSTDQEPRISDPELLHGIDFVNFLENINRKAFGQKGEIIQTSKHEVQKYDFELDGQAVISIQSGEDKIIVSSGIDQKYSVVIDPDYKPSWAAPNDESVRLDIKYVLRSVIVEGLFPGRKNKDQKAEMLKAISDETDISSEKSEPKFCTIKLTYFPFNKD